MPHLAPATVASTRRLLDGAIAAAERAAPTRAEPALTPRRWAWHLIGQWYCAHHSVALLPAAVDRFEAGGRPDLAEFARTKLDEEQGHEDFPLSDLEQLGYVSAACIRDVAPPPEVIAAVEYARACVEGEHPVEFLGYVYALERLILNVNDEWFGMLAAALPEGIEAASGFRLHVSEFDHQHVEDAVEFISGLPAGDRARIALGCYRTTEIGRATFAGQDPSEAELEQLLGRFSRTNQTQGEQP
jgi:hypothetical protein